MKGIDWFTIFHCIRKLLRRFKFWVHELFPEDPHEVELRGFWLHEILDQAIARKRMTGRWPWAEPTTLVKR